MVSQRVIKNFLPLRCLMLCVTNYAVDQHRLLSSYIFLNIKPQLKIVQLDTLIYTTVNGPFPFYMKF